jgi:hypothetical protein
MRGAWLAVAMVFAGFPKGLAAQPPNCPPAVEGEAGGGPLIHLGAALKPGGKLDILAVGAGGGAPAPRPAAPATLPPPHPASFGALLGHFLEDSVHGLHVTVTAQGGGGLSAATQVDIIRQALHAHPYQLVIWQTGTVEAVNDEPEDDFYQALSDGAAAAASGGADLVLVEPQYSRFLEANANVSAYLAVMQAAGALPGTLLFHRYDLMHDWVDSGSIDLENAAAADRSAVAARLRACLAGELARALLSNAAETGD